MKLTELASKPKLIQIVIDDEAVVKEFGEPIEFYTWDRHPMETFLKLAAVDTKDYMQLVDAIEDLVLDEEGNKIFTNEIVLPTKVMTQVITKVVEELGK